MRAQRISARGFRNLAPLDLALPPAGVAFLGPNGHGKTNLLELLYYPVLFRSLRGARDQDIASHGEPGFQLALEIGDGRNVIRLAAGFAREGKRKRIEVDGAEPERLSEALGHWMAVGFLPTDVRLVAGGAAERRHFLDRVLSLASSSYLRTLRRYRAALLQRNAALRQRRGDAARAFEGVLAAAGAKLVAARIGWVTELAPRFAAETAALGELEPVGLAYAGNPALADPAAWPDALDSCRAKDSASGTTGVGPQRDDLAIALGNTRLREVGSTGQHRTAAVALKLCEQETLAAASGQPPSLLLDDVFAELDRERQERLAERLARLGDTQVFITAPRPDELPPTFRLPVWKIEAGEVITA
ncbi:MAG: DNA replication and repair protein RecF [Gemmatimonadota bacterium]